MFSGGKTPYFSSKFNLKQQHQMPRRPSAKQVQLPWFRPQGFDCKRRTLLTNELSEEGLESIICRTFPQFPEQKSTATNVEFEGQHRQASAFQNAEFT
jgi:hypothetical protein